jgi:predicted DNA-binding transcriptional regulator AlpA
MTEQVKASAIRRLALSALGPVMLDMKGIARHLGVQYRTVQNWRADGTLPAPDFCTGRVVRWRLATVARFIADRAGDRGPTTMGGPVAEGGRP